MIDFKVFSLLSRQVIDILEDSGCRYRTDALEFRNRSVGRPIKLPEPSNAVDDLRVSQKLTLSMRTADSAARRRSAMPEAIKLWGRHWSNLRLAWMPGSAECSRLRMSEDRKTAGGE
jgi:hypothetical protein